VGNVVTHELRMIPILCASVMFMHSATLHFEQSAVTY